MRPYYFTTVTLCQVSANAKDQVLSNVSHGLHCFVMKRILSIALALILLFSAAQNAHAQEQERHARFRLVPERTKVTAGDSIYIALEQTLDAGWHSYWTNPGDSGEPMRIEWALPGGFEAGTLKWPVPHKIMVGPLASYGYEGKNIFLQEINIPWDLPAGPVTLRADIDVIICSDICIPETGSYEITLNDTAAPQDNSAYIDQAYKHLPAPFDFDVSFWVEEGKLFFSFDNVLYNVLLKNLKSGTTFLLIPDEWGLVDNTAPTLIDMKTKQGTVYIAQKRGERPLDTFNKVSAMLIYTDINGNPQSVYFTATPKSDWDRSASAITAAPDESQDRSSAPPQRQQDTSFPKAVLFALLGGLILNLMPCVFPVLSLKALKLCRMGGEERAHARLHGLLYTFGILVSFAFFAVALLGLQAAGISAGWGFHLQNPAFIAFLTYLFFIIGLNLAGYFEVMISIGGRDLTKEHGYAATFLSGVLAAVVATPCTAPFMGIAMGYALTQPAATALAVFLALGFGLALPYLALSFIPAMQKIMPKPGRWMETFRKVLAVPMFAAALWLGWIFMQQTGRDGLIYLIGGTAALGVAITLIKLKTKLWCITAAVLILASLLPMMIKTAPVTALAKNGWLPYSTAQFSSLESGDDALFVNMTAAWCITCKINERTSLESREVRDAFKKNSVVLIKGDWTSYNGEITTYLQSFGREGVPLYVYYGPRSKNGERPEPVVLPQILGPDTIIQTINP